MKRIIGLDIGQRRTGVAVSDPLCITAQGIETIHTRGMAQDAARVVEIARAYDTDQIVAGLPLLMSGQEGLQASYVRQFTDLLTQSGLKVRFVDERLTSVSAERVLIEGGVRRDARKQVVDKLAATYILQSFLDMGGWKEDAPNTEETEVFRLMEGYDMEQDNLVVLLDEDGNECRFIHLMTLNDNGRDYIILSPAEEMPDISMDEAVIMRIAQDADGNDVYESLTDEAEMDRVFEHYLQIAEEDEEE